jgi:threonine aldolase
MTDLRSDTVTQPTDAMRDAMFSAKLGDDVYGEDPTVNELEAMAASILGKEAGLFAPSGTQSNLLALLTHCGRGDEYLVGNHAHTYRYEGGGAAVLGGIQPQPITMAPSGEFHFARSRLLCLENTHGGSVLSADYCNQARELCDEFHLALHLDGARLFNAAVIQSKQPAALAETFDTVSICLSKGLGAPVGSVLVGPRDFIDEARRWRKVVGGGMRQAGMLAGAGIYALQNHVDRLSVDHRNAETVCVTLQSKFGTHSARCATNMIHLDLPEKVYLSLAQKLSASGVKVGRPRWVFHLDVASRDVEQICSVINAL